MLQWFGVKVVTRAVAVNSNPSADSGLKGVSLWNNVSAAITLKKIQSMLDFYIMQSSERSSETQDLTSSISEFILRRLCNLI